MRIFRSALALLLVASLAATPALARAVVVLKTAAPISHAQTTKTAMPDCHGTAVSHEQHKPAGHKSCPDCDKTSTCDHEACQLKCFKVVADLPQPQREASRDLDRLAPAQSTPAVPIDREPRTPPPRR